MKSFATKISGFLLLILCLAPYFVYAQDSTTFILVRHAETVKDGTDNPDLSKKGKRRVQKLADHLKKTRITAIYFTPYLRTQHTVKSIAKQKGLAIKEYDPFSPNILDEILTEEQAGIVLISGHSNTTPLFVNALIGKELYQQLDESDYDNLFIVTVTEKGRGQVIQLLY